MPTLSEDLLNIHDELTDGLTFDLEIAELQEEINRLKSAVLVYYNSVAINKT